MLKYFVYQHNVMKYIHLLTLLVFLVPLMQTAYAQSALSQSGSPIVNSPQTTNNPVNNPACKPSLIEDTPNYNKYIPFTGSSTNQAVNSSAQPMGNAGGSGGVATSNPGSSGSVSGNTGACAGSGGAASSNTAASSTASGVGGSSNTTEPIAGALANTTKSIGDAIGKGIAGIVNPGNNPSK